MKNLSDKLMLIIPLVVFGAFVLAGVVAAVITYGVKMFLEAIQ